MTGVGRQTAVMTKLETRIPPPILWALGALVTWVVDRLDIDGSALDGRVWDGLAVLLALMGLGVAVAGFVQFSRANTTVDPHRIEDASTLVVDGIYRFTRNPMYLGLALLSIGWALRLGTIAGMVIGTGAFVAAVTRLQIIPEERVLDSKFGDDFRRYRSKVRRWI